MVLTDTPGNLEGRGMFLRLGVGVDVLASFMIISLLQYQSSHCEHIPGHFIKYSAYITLNYHDIMSNSLKILHDKANNFFNR